MTYQKSATEEETKLAHMAQYLRYDLNLGDAPSQAVFVDAVERKPGALFRATEPAALFGEELEARIQLWLTTARLAVLGGELIGRVEDKLTESKALREMFDLCFPANIAEIVNVTPSQAEAMRWDLQARVVAKTMKCRAKYFAGRARDELRHKITQRQATRAKLQSQAGKGKGKAKGKAAEARGKRRALEEAAAAGRDDDDDDALNDVNDDGDDDEVNDDDVLVLQQLIDLVIHHNPAAHRELLEHREQDCTQGDG